MSDDAPKKKLMPELLPKPVSFPGTAARARVISHLRILAATGAATMTLAACPFIAVDPLPPPPKCRTSRGVAADLVGSVKPGSAFTFDGGTRADGGTAPAFTLTLEPSDVESGGAIGISGLLTATNAHAQVVSPVAATPYRVFFAPIDASQPVELRFTPTCEGTAAVVLVATLTPTSNGEYTVVLTDAP